MYTHTHKYWKKHYLLVEKQIWKMSQQNLCLAICHIFKRSQLLLWNENMRLNFNRAITVRSISL